MRSNGVDGYSLVSRPGLGGVTGGKGYNFQDAFIVSRIPDWLVDPDFSMLIKEGLEDVDVKYVRNSEEEFSCYQIKNHPLKLQELRDVIDTFFHKDKELRNIRSFILACRGFLGRGSLFKEGIEALRETRRMYKGEKLLEDTENQVQRIASEIGFEAPLDFVVEKVFFDTDLGYLTSDKHLCDQFVGAIQRVSDFSDAKALNLNTAYRDLSRLINVAIRKPIKRCDILQTIQKSIESSSLLFEREGIRVRLFHWEDPSFDLSQPWDLLLDWSKEFDRRSRKVPPTYFWNTEIIPQLENSEKTIRSSTPSRKIVFYPSACLSAGLSLGWAFSEVKGYSFVIRQGSEDWLSDTKPSTNRLISKEESLDISSKDLCVEFSVAADVSKKVNEFVEKTRQTFRARISLHPDFGIGSRIDNSSAVAYAYDAKNMIREKIDHYDCNRIHLFFSGPLGLAILFGRLFNAMHANIQCYEEQQEGYTATCLLAAQ